MKPVPPLLGYLGDKFNLPEIAVTTDTLERTMAEKSVAAKRQGRL